MNISIVEASRLPLACAVIDPQGAVIAATPEWVGPSPGSVSYPIRRNRLVINESQVDPDTEVVLDRLLQAMDDVVLEQEGETAQRVQMLAASLRIVAGRQVITRGTTEDVISHAVVGISTRTQVVTEIVRGELLPVLGPEVAALVLTQFAANAEAHEHVTRVTLRQRRLKFAIEWAGRSGGHQVDTTRQQAARQRWGLGFAAIAADTLGAAVYAPTLIREGVVAATLELGVERLALPLGVVRGGLVLRATHPFETETGCTVGEPLPPESPLRALIAQAEQNPGQVAVSAGWFARTQDGSSWVAQPPDGITDRAKDVLHGVSHERALWEGVGEPAEATLFALATLLAVNLGGKYPRTPAEPWNRAMARLTPSFELTDVPRFEGVSAVDARVCAYLARELGERFELDGDDLYLKVRQDRLGHPLVRLLLNAGDTYLRLT
jgi:hypothetical protein